MKIFNKIAVSSVLLSVGFIGCKKPDPLPTVELVDIESYMGKWYEIALFPQSFEKDCTGTTAEYTLKDNGKVKVVNSCNLKQLDGKLQVATGEAYVTETETNAKLKVSFFKPFYGDYWILDLGTNYEYAMVGAPDRNYLWFLSRTPQMKESDFQYLKDKAANLGFDVSKLQVTLQPQPE